MGEVDKKRRAVATQADWERVITAAAHLQRIVPDAILVGGSAAALHADLRFSYDDDHVVVNLKDRYERVLADLERNAGWITHRITPPVQILGQLDGIETGIRNLIRTAPLETQRHEIPAGTVRLPTIREMTRIKAYLIVRRNATRDYIDFVALADKVERLEGVGGVTKALALLDDLYPQGNGSSIILQLARQLSEPKPHDLGNGDLSVYRVIAAAWASWEAVQSAAQRYAVDLLLDHKRTSAANDPDVTRSP